MGFSVSTATNPSYMYQTPSGYIFRLRIPKDLRELVGKCEFRYSLRSGALREAKYRARCVMGDMNIEEIDKQLMSEYKSILMKLPPNLNKSPIYKDMEVDDIIASKPAKTLTVNTLNKYIRRLSGLFNYGVKNGYMSTNPAEGMQIKSQKRPDQERPEYSRSMLIFV